MGLLLPLGLRYISGETVESALIHFSTGIKCTCTCWFCLCYMVYIYALWHYVCTSSPTFVEHLPLLVPRLTTLALDYVVEIYGFDPSLKTRDLMKEFRRDYE